jgi:GNAT superfamily N-acetyltransferase
MKGDSLSIRKLDRNSEVDLAQLQKVVECAPAYWLRISGKTAGPDASTATFHALPDGKTYADKFVLGIFWQDRMIGCADIIQGFPNESTVMLGLLLLSESHQGRGLGRVAYSELETLIRSWSGIQTVRIGVIGTNDIVLPFWKSLGFVETGVRRPYQENGIVSENIILEKRL